MKLDLPGSEESRTSRVSLRETLDEFDGRLVLLGLGFVAVFLVLVARLHTLQVKDGDYYHALASENFVREIELEPDRGVIVDAAGRTVAENRPAYDVWASPRLVSGDVRAHEALSNILDLGQEARDRFERRVNAGGRADVLVARDITRDQLAELETRRTEFPGVYVAVSQRRFYPYDALTAHVVGYMNEIRADELERLAEHGYEPGDYIGRSGIERAFEAVLRGAPGRERQVVNVTGDAQSEDVNRQLLGDYRLVEPIAGRDVSLTLDMAFQSVLDDALADAISGGVVAIDPRDGSVLAMYSKPGFNPNAWSGRLSEQEKRASDNDPFHPMLDKTVQSWFPASTYKVITALAALHDGLVTPETEIECPGHLDYGNRRFHCWNRAGHGPMNLQSALAHSCDVYFYQVGLQLGIDTLAQHAFEFGFGERPGLGVNGEATGVVPTRAWHDEHSPGGFQYGFTVNTSVGQGDTRASPLQLALAYAAIANGGSLYYPRVVDRVTTANGDVVFEYPPRLRRALGYDAAHMETVLAGLEAVVSDEDGTAYEQRLGYMRVAGKTGTAQVRSLESVRLRDGEIVHWDRDHAWFVAFAPVENPRIVVAVFLEHGGQGSSAAAPVAMRVIDRYFREILGWDDAIERAEQLGDRTALDALIAGDDVAPPPLGILRDLAATRLISGGGT